MIEINTLEDYLQLFEKTGWEKTVKGNCKQYQLNRNRGRGKVEIYGNTDELYYIKINFSYADNQVYFFSKRALY